MASPQLTLRVRQKQANAAILISPFDQDHKLLHSLFVEQGWKLYGTGCLQSALSLLRKSVAPIVITEKELPAGNWKDVLGAVSLLPESPRVVVTSLHADDYLWAEALNLGAYDVLAKPIERTEAMRVLNSVWIKVADRPR